MRESLVKALTANKYQSMYCPTFDDHVLIIALEPPMDCFNHANVSAIGTCKACGRGLCSDCVTDLGHGLACKNSHEERVHDLDMIISKNAIAFKDASKNLYIIPIFYGFMGFVFCGYALLNQKSVTDFPFVLGVGFIVFGVILLIRNRKIFVKSTPTSE